MIKKIEYIDTDQHGLCTQVSQTFLHTVSYNVKKHPKKAKTDGNHDRILISDHAMKMKQTLRIFLSINIDKSTSICTYLQKTIYIFFLNDSIYHIFELVENIA